MNYPSLGVDEIVEGKQDRKGTRKIKHRKKEEEGGDQSHEETYQRDD